MDPSPERGPEPNYSAPKINHADFADSERKPLYIFLGCDAVMAKRASNLEQLQIRKEDIPNLEIIQILNFLVDLGLDKLKQRIFGKE